MDNSITHVAMDTHKKRNAVALAYPDTGEVQVFTVKNLATDIKKMVKKIQRKVLGRGTVLLRGRRVWVHAEAEDRGGGQSVCGHRAVPGAAQEGQSHQDGLVLHEGKHRACDYRPSSQCM